MASSRKKQDEKNLKTLRELAAQPQNKYCFDCNQRGPTYVNVTIGAFVCTKCSGILRGITPPHRVKSISMAAFTNEEVDLVRNRGNDYCRCVWLGLFEGTAPTHSGDEQTIRDFMVDKYERRRHYLDPGLNKPELSNIRQTTAIAVAEQQQKNAATRLNNGTIAQNTHRTRPEAHRNNINQPSDFIADFDKADIFSSSNNNTNGSQQIKAFANFDNNPVFNGSVNNTSMPTPANLNTMNLWNNQLQQQALQKPAEDKYAALKDLDNALKTQSTVDWGSSGSNGSLYSSPTPTGSVYSSPSPQNSVFGSPSQGQFMSAFATPQENGTNGSSAVSNPFSNGGNQLIWGSNGTTPNGIHQPFANPFNDPIKMNTNGFSNNFQPAFPMPVNGSSNAWTANPFKVAGTATSMNSNNPFL